MARNPSEFSKMYHTFWSGSTGKALRGDAEAQVIQHYLIDNSHSNMWGLYYLPKAYITHDTGHTEKVINRALKKLDELGFAYYDERSEYVFVVEMAHKQVGELKNGDKRIGSANRFYRDTPHNPFLGMFHDRYAEELSISEDRRGFEGASKGLARGFDGSSMPHRRDYYDADDNADASVDLLSSKTQETTDSHVPQLRRFTDDPQNLVDLWNEMAPEILPRKRKPSDSVKILIRQAYKNVDSREGWVEILNEYPKSSYLRGETSYRVPNLDWLVSVGKNKIENYISVQGGAYRDKCSNGLSDLSRQNLEAAESFLRQHGQTLMGDGNEQAGHGNVLEGVRDVVDQSWRVDQPGSDEHILSRPLRLLAGDGPGCDAVGEAEYEILSDDRRLTDSDRGE